MPKKASTTNTYTQTGLRETSFTINTSGPEIGLSQGTVPLRKIKSFKKPAAQKEPQALHNLVLCGKERWKYEKCAFQKKTRSPKSKIKGPWIALKE